MKNSSPKTSVAPLSTAFAYYSPSQLGEDVELTPEKYSAGLSTLCNSIDENFRQFQKKPGRSLQENWERVSSFLEMQAQICQDLVDLSQKMKAYVKNEQSEEVQRLFSFCKPFDEHKLYTTAGEMENILEGAKYRLVELCENQEPLEHIVSQVQVVARESTRAQEFGIPYMESYGEVVSSMLKKGVPSFFCDDLIEVGRVINLYCLEQGFDMRDEAYIPHRIEEVEYNAPVIHANLAAGITNARVTWEELDLDSPLSQLQDRLLCEREQMYDILAKLLDLGTLGGMPL